MKLKKIDNTQSMIDRNRFEDRCNVMQKIINSINTAEEKVIRSALRQVLGREPTLEDAKDAQLYFHEGEPYISTLAFKGNVLGTIHKNINVMEGKSSVDFHPIKHTISKQMK